MLNATSQRPRFHQFMALQLCEVSYKEAQQFKVNIMEPEPSEAPVVDTSSRPEADLLMLQLPEEQHIQELQLSIEDKDVVEAVDIPEAQDEAEAVDAEATQARWTLEE